MSEGVINFIERNIDLFLEYWDDRTPNQDQLSYENIKTILQNLSSN
jgi:hypothetical protein